MGNNRNNWKFSNKVSTKQILNIDIILILLHFFRWAEKIIKAENISAVIVIKELSLTKNVKITVKTFGAKPMGKPVKQNL